MNVNKMLTRHPGTSSECLILRMPYIIWSHLPKKPLMENVIFCAVGAVHNG